MANQKKLMCSMLLVMLGLVFVTDLEAISEQDLYPDCWTPSSHDVSCSPPKGQNEQNCNSECIQEKYDYGSCKMVRFIHYQCLCHVPSCGGSSMAALSNKTKLM
ncbi:hypothetical protein ACP4OV_023198 [Aristida adscensionis]